MTGPVDFSYREPPLASTSATAEGVAVTVPPDPPQVAGNGSVLTPTAEGGMDIELPEGTPPDSEDLDGGAADTTGQQTADASKPPTSYKIEHDQSPALTADQRQMSIYGETASLYPHSLDPQGAHNDPRNWDTDSRDDLQRARTYMGIVARRNGDTHWAWPNFTYDLETQAWNRAEEPANRSADDSLLGPNITNFAIRGDGVATQFFRKDGLKRYLTIGPFRKIGPLDSGGVPPGNNAYVEFYGKP